ncbi:hypothetical protein D3C85_311580 [compost metagenome]|jgi:uncharacterized membrane protein
MWTLVIIIHAVTASLSLLLGAFQLLRPKKGDRFHRMVGRTWLVCMYSVCVSSFFIQGVQDGFSWLHALSLFTIMTISLGLYSAIKGNIAAHKANMIGSYFGSIAAFVGVIAVPTRRIPQLAINQTPLFFLFIGLLVASTGLFLLGLYYLARKRSAVRRIVENG